MAMKSVVRLSRPLLGCRAFVAAVNGSSYANLTYDLVVVGGGIVGVATAREIALRRPGMNIAILEKERELASHQTGHNSGVMHAGIYYKPGSLKAKLCIKGIDLLYAYCNMKHIPYKKCGKVVVAVEPAEVPELRRLFERAQINGVRDAELIGPERLREIEPHCRGLLAIHSPHTGIINFAQVTHSFADDFRNCGGHVYTNYQVKQFVTFKEPGSMDTLVGIQAQNKPMIFARSVIACCGLHSDRVARLSGCSPEPKVLPFRGEFLVLKANKQRLVRGNIYPVPNPSLPFLGVHFTPRMDGSVWLGPNAVLAFSREGYSYTDFNWEDFQETMQFSGMRRLVGQYWMAGSRQLYLSAVVAAQVKELQKYIADIGPEDVEKGPAGVRALAVDRKGNMVDDFVFDQGTGAIGSRMLHVRNAPSPAATSSLAIADMVASRAQGIFKWT